jgi:hypothetical protein
MSDKKRWTVLTAIGCAAIIGVTVFTTTTYHSIHASVKPLHLSQYTAKYGLDFIPSQSGAKDAAVPQSEAIADVQKLFSQPQEMDATYGYLSTRDEGPTVYAPSWTSASKKDHGKLSKYPVWIVRVSNQHIEAMGPKKDTSSMTEEQKKQYEQSSKTVPGNAWYAVVDANTGDVLFMNAMTEQ